MNLSNLPPMEPKEIRLALKSLSADHHFLRAVMVALGNAKANATSMAIQPELSNDKRNYFAGWAAGVASIQEEFIETIEASPEEDDAASDMT